MDELIVNQIKYISSKRAAEMTGYAKDYIGQLVRLGKISAQKVGRAWYVSESEILAHAGKVPEVETATRILPKPTLAPKLNHRLIEYKLPKTWSSIKYIQDDGALYPVLAVRTIEPEKVAEPVPVRPVRSAQVQTQVSNRVATKISASRDITGVRVISRTDLGRIAPDVQKSLVAEARDERTEGDAGKFLMAGAARYAGALGAVVMVLLLVPILS